MVDYHKFYLYSIVPHSSAYLENDPVSSQNDSVNEFKGGLKRIYRAEYQTSF